MNLSLESHYTNEEFLEYQYIASFVKEWESEAFFKKEEDKKQAYFLVMNFDWIFRYQYWEIYALIYLEIIQYLNNKVSFLLSSWTE